MRDDHARLLAELRRERDELRSEFEAYSLGDRPMSPPVAKIRRWLELERDIEAITRFVPKDRTDEK